MSLRLYFFSLISIIIISISLWALLVFNINPYLAPGWIIFLFYLTIFLFIMAVLAIFGLRLKFKLSNREVLYSHIPSTLRQSAFLALTIVGLLFFKQLKVLNIWVGLLFVTAIILIELFFHSRKRYTKFKK